MKGSSAEMFRVLGYPGSRIAVEGPRADVAWMVQFLAPCFQSRASGMGDWTFRLVRDQMAFQRALESGPDPRGRRRPAYLLDTRTETLSLWGGPADSTRIFDRSHRVFATLRNHLAEADLLAPEDLPLSRLAFMKIVREHALTRLMGREGLLLHASAILLGRKAALFIGEKRSGKTSLMLHSLFHQDRGPAPFKTRVRFLANDRVWVSLEGSPPRARGFPTIASLRISGLELFPELAGRLEESTWTPTATLRESRRRSASPSKPWGGRKYTLSPKQLCRLLDVSPAAEGRVGALLFPTITDRPGGIRVARMPPEVAMGALRSGLFRAGISQKAGGVFAAPGFPRSLTALEEGRRIIRLVGAVPSFSISLGRQAYSDRSWFPQLAQLVEDAPSA